MMTNEKGAVDRRQQKRFKLKPGAVVLLVQDWPESTIVGNILDISSDGIAVQIVGDEDLPESTCELGVASANPHFFLGKVPAKAVSDFAMAKIPFGALVPRRLGMKFGPLTDDQTSNLESYIRDNAVAGV
jgi:hypothetical protein